MILTIDALRSVLNYNPATGTFHWKIRPRQKSRKGDVAGTKQNTGYISICIKGKRYLAHRLAWFYLTGKMPADQIDHINGVRNDNRFNNLREASLILNNQNRRTAEKRSATGYLGVFPWGNRFLARIHANGGYQKLGVFDTAEEAHQVYLVAKRRLHPGCTI